MPKLVSKRGNTYGLLTVIKRDLKRSRVYWLCKCTCGTVKSVRSDELGKSTFSCGCYSRELTRKAREGNPSSLFKIPKHRLFYYVITRPLHEQIRLRDGNKCVLCGTKKPLHIHHILRKSKYGNFLLEPCNLVSLCEKCHLYDAHLGNTSLINIELSSFLLNIVFENEIKCPTPEKLINKIKSQLYSLLNF